MLQSDPQNSTGLHDRANRKNSLGVLQSNKFSTKYLQEKPAVSMTWQPNPFVFVYFLATILGGAILVYTLSHRHVKGAFFFASLTASAVIWSLFQTLEYAVIETAAKIIFAKFQYLGISTIGVTWYLFALSYNRKENWLSKNYFFLLVIPVFTIVMAFTNDLHGLLWPKIEPVSNQPAANLIYSHGPAFWVIFVYNYIVLAFGTVLIVRTAISSKEIYRWQMIGLIFSAIIPWLGNLIYASGLSPVPGLDLTPLGFIASVLVTAWSIFFLRLLDLLPVAHDQVVANLTDGVVVLDVQNRIAYANPKARQMLNNEKERIVGRNIMEVLQPWPGLVESLRKFDLGQMEVEVGDERISDLDIRVTALLDNNRNRVGRIAIFRDISQPKKLERVRADLTQSIVNDLRNPLTSMSINLEMLRRQSTTLLPKSQIETLDMSQTILQQTLEQIESILDIYRLQSGEIPLARKATSLKILADEAFRNISGLASKKRILLQSDIPEGIQPLMLDPGLMRRVLQNLLGNSIKQSQEGRIVRLNARYDKNGVLVLSVIDSAEATEIPFSGELFKKSTKGQANNSLSWAFCRLAIEAHGGDIWLDEGYENGTKISLSLPDIH